jgi:predicted transcriptional regulator of viral defense system
MSSRSLSPLEAKLILQLEWKKQPVINIGDTMKILGVSNEHARQLLHGLARDHGLAMIQAGKFELIPAERAEYAFPDTNPLFLGSMLIQPYYFSFTTAGFFHGLSTQASHVIFIATSQDLPRHRWVREKEYRLVFQPKHIFFGWSEVDAYGSRVNMAEPEKALLDSLAHPSYAGDIPEIAAMLWRGRNSLERQKMVKYAVHFRSRALLQRLGCLLENVKKSLSIPKSAIHFWRRRLQMGSVILASLGAGERAGPTGPHGGSWIISPEMSYLQNTR